MERRRVYRPALALLLALTTAAALPADAGNRPVAALPGAPACAPSQAAPDAPQTGNSAPPQAPAYFAKDFPVIQDSRLHVPVGGFGGLREGAPLHHTPIVFVHGNQADAGNWLSPMLQFEKLAHYSMQEMYAVSYNGLGNFYGSWPAQPPTQPDQDYYSQNPQGFANGGHGASDEDEVPDLCRFIEAVQAYTGSRKVDIVAHSLGVTIARKTLQDYPPLQRDVVAFVGIAGANHGTTICRGLDTSYYGCNEIAPGTPWLRALNHGDPTPGPTRWMSIYNGSAGDYFFDPPLDESSPHLPGAANRTYPGTTHNDLRVDPSIVDDYLAFLLRHGQAGGPSETELRVAQRLQQAHPDGSTGELCGVPKLTGC